jgi:cytochrome c biogenesis protein CcmG, thiol:disulfide interchange protein DsbE
MPAARTGGAPLVATVFAVALAVLAPQARGGAPAIAPDFERKDLDGHSIRLSRYRGKLVLLSFWATWCEPCRAEAPRFSRWQQQYGPHGLQVVGISMDDDAAPVAEFVRQLHLVYPIIVGDAPLAERFGGVLGLPLAFLIDPKGRIIARYRGEPDLDRMEAGIRAALPSPAP